LSLPIAWFLAVATMIDVVIGLFCHLSESGFSEFENFLNSVVVYPAYYVIARYEAIFMLYRVTLQIGDCFVPRNDVWALIVVRLIKFC